MQSFCSFFCIQFLSIFIYERYLILQMALKEKKEGKNNIVSVFYAFDIN